MRFKHRSVAWLLSACFGGFLLIGVAGLTSEQVGSGSFVFFLVLSALSALLVFRTFRMATIIVKSDTFVIRGFLRTTRIPIETILSVEPIEAGNMYGMAGQTLAIHMADGRRVVAGEFWARVDRSGRAPRIDTIVRELDKLRQSPDPSGSEKFH
jgi:hypothetical protein